MSESTMPGEGKSLDPLIKDEGMGSLKGKAKLLVSMAELERFLRELRGKN